MKNICNILTYVQVYNAKSLMTGFTCEMKWDGKLTVFKEMRSYFSPTLSTDY